MEMLPFEMVLKISKQLTPEDLACCCGVSTTWREIFNQDLLWKPHCNPVLEEHLRTTPCMVDPVFVAPGDEDSTLTAISQWRLAFLREKHLRDNWKYNNYHKTDCLALLNGEVHNEFFTDILVVRWCVKHVEVWNVSVDPPVLVAKTDPTVVDIAGWVGCAVSESRLLVVQQITSVKVLFVDVDNNRIHLNHDIPLDDVRDQSDNFEYGQLNLNSSHSEKNGVNGLNCIKRRTLLHVNVNRSKLDIFDLKTGKKVKEEPCPEIKDAIERPIIYGVSSSDTSEYVVVVVKCETNSTYYNNCFYYIYNTQELCLLPGPVAAKRAVNPDYGYILHNYFAICENDDTFTIYDCHSSEILLTKTLGNSEEDVGFYCPGVNEYFVFKEERQYQNERYRSLSLLFFSLSSMTWTTIAEFKDFVKGTLIRNKLFTALDRWIGWYILLGNEWVECDLPSGHKTDINQALTKVISISPDIERDSPTGLDSSTEMLHIYHYW